MKRVIKKSWTQNYSTHSLFHQPHTVLDAKGKAVMKTNKRQALKEPTFQRRETENKTNSTKIKNKLYIYSLICTYIEREGREESN